MSSYPQIPDPAYAKGVSAPFCGFLDACLIVAGGANFPDKPLLEGGAKKVYDDIWRFDGSAWECIGHLEDSTAYGATFQLPDALVFAGGSGQDKVYLLDSGGLRRLPSLPELVSEAGASACGERLYLAGAGKVYSCKAGEWQWDVLAEMPAPLVQPLLFATSEWLYLWGGFNPDTLEVPSCGWKLSLSSPEDGWQPAPGVPDGGTFVGAAGVPLPDGRLAVVGGVNRDIFSRALHNTPEDRIPYLSKLPAEYRFRKTVYIFDPAGETWCGLLSDDACALAGPGLAFDGASLVVAGGEIKPGVRSPRIFSIKL